MSWFSKIMGEESREVTETIEAKCSKPIRRIVNGLLYDNSKSTLLFLFKPKDYWKNSFPGIIPDIPAILFRTKRGRFFIQQFGCIYPCEEITAKYILGYNPEKYIEIFGEVEEA